jgi:hypothetical protein
MPRLDSSNSRSSSSQILSSVKGGGSRASSPLLLSMVLHLVHTIVHYHSSKDLAFRKLSLFFMPYQLSVCSDQRARGTWHRHSIVYLVPSEIDKVRCRCKAAKTEGQASITKSISGPISYAWGSSRVWCPRRIRCLTYSSLHKPTAYHVPLACAAEFQKLRSPVSQVDIT